VGPPAVSVIVPVFNADAFVGEALDSIRAQAYEPLETLVVDDGSTDRSADVVAAVARERPDIRLLRLPGNRGPAAARNAGLAAARGGLITFLDADDLMAPGRVRFQVDYLAGHPEVDVVLGTETLVLAPGASLPAWLAGRPASRPRYHQMTMMARPAVFERAGPFDESFRVSSDTEWAQRARAAAVSTALVDRVLVTRRIHGANLTYRTEALQEARARILLGAARRYIRQRGPGR
jgi:glycosyltransferase involved in cell wall biosynthesis